MGKLKIKGMAHKEVPYDLMELSISFKAYAKTAEVALSKVLSDCEAFLLLLKREGLKADQLHAAGDHVNQMYFDNSTTFCASREITIKVAFQMEFTNYLLSLIAEKGYNAEITTRYLLSDPEGIKEQLLKEAVTDAQKKAETMAKTLGQTLLSIDSIEVLDSDMERAYILADYAAPMRVNRKLEASNELMAPVSDESATVEVVWMIES